jgi:hypothetical protein
MPVQPCGSGGKPGYRFGESGKCYTYTPGNAASRRSARSKAQQQERAAYASGWKESIAPGDMKKELPPLPPAEQRFANALLEIAADYGKLEDGDETGIWIGYVSASENDDAEIGVKCSNCYFYESENVCKIIAQSIEPNGMCRLAAIPPGLVMSPSDDTDDDMDDEMDDDIDDDHQMRLGVSSSMNKTNTSKQDTKEFHLAQVQELLNQAEWHSKMAESTGDGERVFVSDERKQDLAEILKDHIQEYGSFSRTVEEIVEFLSEG